MINTTAQNALKNSVYNFIGFVVPILVTIFIIPVIISRLGVKDYGLYIFLNTIVVFLGLLDLGVSTATGKYLVEYYSTNQLAKLKKLIYSMNSVYLILAVAYLGACLIMGYLLPVLFPERLSGNTNFSTLFLLVGLTSFVYAIFSNFYNLFVVIQRYDIHLKLSLSFLILTNLGILLLAVWGYGLVSILFYQLIVAIISVAIYYFFARKTFSLMRLSYGWDKDIIKQNYKFGIFVAFNNLANSSLVHFDKLLIPIFVGNAQLTYYSVPGSIATKISSLSGTFSSLLFPITVSLQASNDLEKIKRVYKRSIRLITILSAAISFSIVFFADKILLFWLDETFMRNSAIVLVLLVITNFILALYSPLSNLLLAMGRTRFLTTSSIVMAILNFVALVILLPGFGINGAAAAYLIGVLYVFFMLYFIEKNYLGIQHFRNHIFLFLKLIITAIPLFILTRYIFSPLIKNFISILLIGPASVILFIILFKLFGFFENEDWDDLKVFTIKIFEKVGLRKIISR